MDYRYSFSDIVARVCIHMNGYYKMKAALEQQGWYVGWALGFFQDEAWCNTPYEFPPDHPRAGEKVDSDKCLFNIIQDVQLEDEYILELDDKLEAGEIDEETYEDLCDEFYEDENYEEPYESPDEADGSCFCFGNVETLKEIIPIIEECGCEVNWNGSITRRPYISWSK